MQTRRLLYLSKKNVFFYLTSERMVSVMCDQAVQAVEAVCVYEIELRLTHLLLQLYTTVIYFPFSPKRKTIVTDESYTLTNQECSVSEMRISSQQLFGFFAASSELSVKPFFAEV